MKNLLAALFIIACSLSTFAQRPDFSMVGFATLNGGTTGGNAATNITDVHNAAELIAAIGIKKAGGQDPRIIRVNGTIDNGGQEIEIKECANLTLIGANENALISKTPLIITSSSNIIIRNLKFTMIGQGGGKDIIEITTTGSNWCRNIWIDHCEFYNETPTAEGAEKASVKDKYDGLVDMKKNSEYITISWCYFHDHYKAILVGFSTDKDPIDRKITMHHNRFVRINSRVPSYRAGTAHIYNNYFEGWIENGQTYGNMVHARDASNLKVENNYFKDLAKAVYWDPKDSPTEGFAWGFGNIYDNVQSEMTTRTHENPFEPPYEADQDEAANIPSLTEYAGVGIITSHDDYGDGGYGGDDVNKAPTVTITSPDANASFDAPANIILRAEASDEDGSISKVEIYNGEELITTLTEAPYFHSFTDLMVGDYTFRVKAFDNEDKTKSASVTIKVITPTLPVGESIFGSAAPANDYFRFVEANIDKTNELINNATITGVSFNPTKVVSTSTHQGAIYIPKSTSAVFELPSCTVFKLFLSRTGDFGGNVYVSTDNINWGASKAGISGKKGEQEVDYSDIATSASKVYVKIENTSGGDLNIHGADIRLAGGTSSLDHTNTENKEIASIRYYNLAGMQVEKPQSMGTYIQEIVYEDNSVERLKVFIRY